VATKTKQVILKITYDDEVIGDPEEEWDWDMLLNHTGDSPQEKVQVEVVSGGGKGHITTQKP